ncbi:MAG: hypothetical protein K2J82_02100 [Muribaculaceae bacterium]|nr:hypothetical protein [Muribaculaceae bacterium]
MKKLKILLLLLLPFNMLADTEEVDMDEDKVILPPIKRSLAPKPKVFIIDKTEVRIEFVSDTAEGSLTICDENSNLIYQASYLSTYYDIPTLAEGEVYSIYLYVNNHRYTGTYLP